MSAPHPFQTSRLSACGRGEGRADVGQSPLPGQPFPMTEGGAGRRLDRFPGKTATLTSPFA